MADEKKNIGPEAETCRAEYSKNEKTGESFNDSPDGRNVIIGFR